MPLLRKVSEFVAHRSPNLSGGEPGDCGQPAETKMSDTLTCWKEIAQYFGKGVRTVQRWEREAGLPVRRVNGGKGRVFALPQELGAWLQSSTAWIEGNAECELARLRKEVTVLSLENGNLRRKVAELEEEALAMEHDEGHCGVVAVRASHRVAGKHF